MKEKALWFTIGAVVAVVAYPQISKLPFVSRLPQV